MNTLLMLFIFVPILAVLFLGLNLLFAINKPDEAKESVYECGFNSVYGQTRSTFQIHFFLVALLFLVFDLESAITISFSSYIVQSELFWFLCCTIFFIVLTIGFILEIGTELLKLQQFQ